MRVAIKIIDKNKLDEVSKLHLYKEVTCMKLLRHPNVIRLYEAIDTTNHLFLVMELGDSGDLLVSRLVARANSLFQIRLHSPV